MAEPDERSVEARLVFGMATLMREPSARIRQSILSEVRAAGIDSFDVAPLYGLGRAEAELGRHLRVHPGAAVTTKVGLRPGTAARALARVQAPARWAAQRLPALRRVGKAAVTQSSSVELTADVVRESLSSSLDALGTASVDTVLLHDVPWSPAAAEAIEELRRAAAVRRVGVSGEEAVLRTVPESALTGLALVQTTIAGAAVLPAARPPVAVHSVLRLHLADAMRHLEDGAFRARVSGLLGRPASPADAAPLIVATVLASGAADRCLVSTSRSGRVGPLADGVRELWTALQEPRAAADIAAELYAPRRGGV